MPIRMHVSGSYEYIANLSWEKGVAVLLCTSENFYISV